MWDGGPALGVLAKGANVLENDAVADKLMALAVAAKAWHDAGTFSCGPDFPGTGLVESTQQKAVAAARKLRCLICAVAQASVNNVLSPILREQEMVLENGVPQLIASAIDNLDTLSKEQQTAALLGTQTKNMKKLFRRSLCWTHFENIPYAAVLRVDPFDPLERLAAMDGMNGDHREKIDCIIDTMFLHVKSNIALTALFTGTMDQKARGAMIRAAQAELAKFPLKPALPPKLGLALSQKASLA